MPYLQAVEARRDQRLEPLAPTTIARMRPDRQGAGFVCNRDCISDRKMLLRDERASRVAEIPCERFPKIGHDAAGYQCTRYMGSADRATIGLLEHFVQSERNAERVQLVHDLLSARVSHCAQLAETPLQSFEVCQMKRQKMDFVPIVKRAQLYSGNYSNPQSLAGRPRRRNAIDRVVICQCQRSQTAAFGGFYGCFGSDRTVRGSRVGVQVVDRRPARIRAHRS